MASYPDKKKYAIVPSGKYRGWTVNQVPDSYWSWLYSYGQTSGLYKWLCEKPKSSKQRALDKRTQKRRDKKLEDSFTDHLTHQSEVRFNSRYIPVVYCLKCSKEIHILSRKQFNQYKEQTK